MDPKLDLNTTLDLHAKWLRDEPDGVRANLAGANLEGAYLAGANLEGAYLVRANLVRANLAGANLAGAYLVRAYLEGAYLVRANLVRANLAGANLAGAYLAGANLEGAKLEDCTGADLALAMASHLPEGPFHAWKQCRDKVLVKLEVPAKARRSHGSERKCRAEFAKVLQVVGAEVGISIHDGKTEYRKGQMVYPDGWDEDRWNTCGRGIHFYLTRIEAENHL
jgi:hypothetical protein